MHEGLSKLWEKIKKNKYVLAVLLIGLVLILLPGRSSDKSDTASDDGIPGFSLSDEENRIERSLSEVDGAGKVTVILTLKTSLERVVAEDTESSVSENGGEYNSDISVKTVIISSGSSNENPVTLKYNYPEYMGALVIAEGAGSADVRLRLTQAVSVLTGLRTDKITVIKMKGS